MYQSLPSLIVTGLMIVVCVFAGVAGRTLHRVVAALLAANWLLSGLVQDRQDWVSPQWAILSLDLLLAGVATILALRQGGWWLLTFTAFTWLQVFTHFAMLFDDRVLARAYLTALGLWSLAQLIALALGAWEAWAGHRVRAP